MQGIVGSIPWTALVFFTLYLQLLGMSDFAASVLMALFLGSTGALQGQKGVCVVTPVLVGVNSVEIRACSPLSSMQRWAGSWAAMWVMWLRRGTRTMGASLLVNSAWRSASHSPCSF